MDRATDYESVGQRFESSRAYVQSQLLTNGRHPKGARWLRGRCGRLRQAFIARGLRRFRWNAIIEAIDGLPIGTGDQVAVNVHGALDGVMSHLFLHVLRRLPLLEQQRRERGAQVMKTDPPQPGL